MKAVFTIHPHSHPCDGPGHDHGFVVMFWCPHRNRVFSPVWDHVPLLRGLNQLEVSWSWSLSWPLVIVTGICMLWCPHNNRVFSPVWDHLPLLRGLDKLEIPHAKEAARCKDGAFLLKVGKLQIRICDQTNQDDRAGWTESDEQKEGSCTSWHGRTSFWGLFRKWAQYP